MKFLQGLVLFLAALASDLKADSLYDATRDRHIPIEITYPQIEQNCTELSPCSVAFLGAGYGISHLEYTFLSNQLKALGYLVVAIGHELPNDPPLSVTGNLYETRSENWQRGADTLAFVQAKLSKQLPTYDFDNLLLVGHSNGGDISAWLANEAKPYIKTLITLDHRRVPLPRNTGINVQTIRASDFPADKGVLPEKDGYSRICVVTIPESRHNDIADFGPEWLKERINALVSGFLHSQSCDSLQDA